MTKRSGLPGLKSGKPLGVHTNTDVFAMNNRLLFGIIYYLCQRKP